jgi:hypothetical protein
MSNNVGRLIANGIELQVEENLDILLSFIVADIRQLENRNSALSLSVVVLDTPAANQLFNNIYDINARLTTFNPAKKTPCSYYSGDVELFRGNLQLIEVEKRYVGQLTKARYRCFLVGLNADLFVTLRTRFLTDINFSDLNHVFQDVASNFQPVLGVGYGYPYIDYGLTVNGSNYIPATDKWTFTNLKPGIFEREYLRRIFLNAGFTWTSTFLDSAYYSHIFIPNNYGGAMKTTNLPPVNSQFAADRLVNFLGTTKGGAFNAANQWQTFYNNGDGIIFPIKFEHEITDPSNIYNPANGECTVLFGGKYVFNFKINLNLHFVCQNQIRELEGVNGLSMSFDAVVYHATNGGAGPTNAIFYGNISVPVDRFFPSGVAQDFTASASFSTPTGTVFQKNDRVFIYLFQSSNNAVFTKDVGGFIINQNVSMRVDIQVGSSFSNTVVDFNLPYGATVEMNQQIPSNISQLDFLKGIIISENLYIEQDPNNRTNFFIEPRDQFINSQPFLNWTNRVDTSQPIKILPSGVVNIRQYTFRQKIDNDFANADSIAIYKKRYAEFDKFTFNDFASEEKVIEPIFASTPNVGNTVNNIVTPALYRKRDASNIETMDTIIRRLYWVGRIPCNPYTWYNGNGGTVNGLTEYTYAGSTDHPQTMTLDLGFGVPSVLFYKLTGVYTTNNRYEARYKKLIESVIDPDSKMVTMFLNLTPVDIFNFSFRRVVYVIDAYYYVNSIKGYNPQKNKAVEVELLWLDSADFTPLP